MTTNAAGTPNSPYPHGEPGRTHVCFSWEVRGAIVLDRSARPSFPPLPDVPGVYRLIPTGCRACRVPGR
ncbi:hypothetical protein [Embleya sp. NPDC020630]|uniref:hypothetical protein n=1 Tax=Embleya sp. NPDC020630 TaxID=3363979 RepID=UPI0037B5629A